MEARDGIVGHKETGRSFVTEKEGWIIAALLVGNGDPRAVVMKDGFAFLEYNMSWNNM